MSISAILSFVAEGNLKSDFLVKSGIDDLDRRGVLINPSQDSVPQTFPGASVTGFTRRSTAGM